MGCGFLIKANICDQNTDNVATLKLLTVTKHKQFFFS